MTPEHLGFIPGFLSDDDPRPAKEQINEKYVSGWNKFDGFELNEKSMELSYSGDPPMTPLAATHLKDELIFFYPHAWLLILQPDHTWEVARLD
jgi:hypothetical protein